MDGSHLMTDLHDDAEARKKAFRCLKSQLLRICDHISDIIWKSAVCIGNISGTFKYNNFCFFIQSSDTSCSSCTACHTADNYYFHLTFPPFLNMRKNRRYWLHLHILCAAAYVRPDCFWSRNNSRHIKVSLYF